jgi:hypothetical protein
MSKNRKKQKIRVMRKMIELYCHEYKHCKQGICNECSKLLKYANKRITYCPYSEINQYCNTCKTHCYKPEMRDKICAVMRYSGPRMLLYHPIIAIEHLVSTIRFKRKQF